MQNDWRILNTKGNRVLRRGDPWTEDDPLDAYDQCEECRTEIRGKVVVGPKSVDDETIVIQSVRELGF